MQKTRFTHKSAMFFASAAVLSTLLNRDVLAGEYSITKTSDTTIDSRGLVLDNSVAAYGIGINGTSFENSAIQTFNGWQYAAYWVKSGANYFVAMGRRQTGAATWQVADLTSSTMVNGLSGGKPSDAHNVVSFGIDQVDGTIHLAYDLHGHTLKYRVSQAGVTTNPNAISQAQWTQSLFNAQTSQLVTGTNVTGVTYPHFFNTNSGALQFTYRTGGSGNGSNWMADYNGSTHTWSNVHQYDNGATGNYTGTVTVGDTNRNSYINGATYGPSGRLYQSFTWREGATGAANHDINFVYSDDNGNTWKNNAGTTVGSVSPVVRFNLNSPGLIVVPLSESMSLMNQQTQAVSGNSAVTERFHTLMWHRDTAKTASGSSTVWDPVQSSYFHYWRDTLGNFHRNKLPGSVGQRPKILFDANENAIAIYQAGAFSSQGLYINNGDLIIATASKASNWSDWKIIKTETGPFVSETQADARLLASNGTLSIVMQQAPGIITPAQGTNMRVLDYSIALAPATDRTLGTTGNWSTASNWSGSTIPIGNANAIVGSGRTLTINSSLSTVDNSLIIGTGAASGTLNLSSGGLLTVGGSVIVGRDANSVGTYNQTGGTLNSNRFVVGDFYTETSGGGSSSATVSGGTLNTNELQVAVSANGSSNNSVFNLSGTGIVNVDGEVIIADCGNVGSVVIAGGTMTVAGDIREGFNGANTSTLTVNAGTLNMTSNTISVDNVILNGGTIANASFTTLGGTGGVITRTDGATAAIALGSGSTGASIQNGNGLASLTKNTTGTLTLSGTSTYTGATFVSAGTLIVTGQLANTSGITLGTGGGAAVLRAQSALALGSGNIQFDPTGNGSTARLELAGGASLNNTITFAGRTSNSVGIENISGNNTIAGTISLAIGGGSYWIESDADKLTLSATTAITALATGTRTATLQGAGDGEISGAIVNGSATVAITKLGSGTWTLSGNNTYTGVTLISAGTLEVGNGGTTGNISPLDLTNNGTFRINRSNAYSFANIISGTGGVTQAGTGTTTLTGVNTFVGPTAILDGTLEVGNGGTTGNISAGNLTNNGTFKINRSNAYDFSSIISGNGGVTQAGTGTTTLSAANTYTGVTSVTGGTLEVSGSITSNAAANISSGASLNVTGTGIISLDLLTNNGTFNSAHGGSVDGIAGTGTSNLTSGTLNSSLGVVQNTLAISGNASVVVAANGSASGVSKIRHINIASSGLGYAGLLDLMDNDLVIDNTGGGTSYADVLVRVKSGLTLLGGNGTGIGSSSVDAQTLVGTVLGVVDDSAIDGGITSLSGYSSFNPNSSILVKYTWFGDANFDGVVDGADYALLDTGFTSGGTLTGWVFGDFDYNGAIDGADYGLIDTGFVAQTAALPEPSILGLFGLGVMSFLRRRTR